MLFIELSAKLRPELLVIFLLFGEIGGSLSRLMETVLFEFVAEFLLRFLADPRAEFLPEFAAIDLDDGEMMCGTLLWKLRRLLFEPVADEFLSKLTTLLFESSAEILASRFESGFSFEF